MNYGQSKNSVENYLSLDEAAHDEDISWSIERGKWPESQLAAIALDGEDPWIICYTGGTTDLPKGAVLNYSSVTWNSVNTIVSWGLSPDDVVTQYMPMFHAGGLNVLALPLVHHGAMNIICSAFDVEQFFEQIENLGVTFFFAVPAMFLMMIQHPRWEALVLSKARLVMLGGGDCPRVVYEEFWKKGVEFKEEYGPTEASPNTIWFQKGEVKNETGSVGRLKHMIKSGGENFYPAEIEDVPYSHPDILGAAVIPSQILNGGRWGALSPYKNPILMRPGLC